MPLEYEEYKASRKKGASTRGADFERQCKKALEEAGWLVIRAAGSRGSADIVGLRSSNRPILVQCKTNPCLLKRAERDALLADSKVAGGIPVLAYKGPKGKGIQWQDVKSSRPLNFKKAKAKK